MPVKKIDLTVEIPTENPVRARDIEKAFRTIAALPADDLSRIMEIAQNPKALDGLRKHWSMLKGMFN